MVLERFPDRCGIALLLIKLSTMLIESAGVLLQDIADRRDERQAALFCTSRVLTRGTEPVPKPSARARPKCT